MRIKKKAWSVVLIFSLCAGLFSACGQSAHVAEPAESETGAGAAGEMTEESKAGLSEIQAEENNEPTEPVPEGMVKSTVTGEYIEADIGNRRPVAVMIDNIDGACPQSGIGDASLYFESPVEGRYTRMCAVFEKYDNLPRIGPIRSCRDYFISLAHGLDDIYTHYGQAAYALPYLESDDVDNLSGLAYYAEPYFYRDNTYHVAPHNAYTSGERINAAIAAREYRKNHEEDYASQYNFCWVGESVDLSGGQSAEYVSPGYPINHPWFVYQPESGTYLRYQYGGAHIDAETGKQLEVKNIIFEFHNYEYYQNSEYLHVEIVSEGQGVYISDGKCVQIRWKRPGFYDQVTYYDEDGNELEINTGKSWIGIIQNEYLADCKVGSSAEDAACVVNDEDLQFAQEYNADWRLAYKAHEEPYLSEKAHEREMWLEKHGGQSKVEG